MLLVTVRSENKLLIYQKPLCNILTNCHRGLINIISRLHLNLGKREQEI